MTTPNTDLISGGDNPPQDTSKSKPDGKTILEQLVGEGKPFKSVEDLAVGKWTADQFIETLKGENADMRRTVGQMETSTETNKLLKDLMAKLVPASNDGSESGDQSDKKTLTQEDIVNMVQATLKQNEEGRNRISNRTKANMELLNFFRGDETKAKAFVGQRAAELGLSRDQLAAMAETQPQVFLSVMGVVKRTAPDAGGVLPLDQARNPDAPYGADGVQRNFAYYKDLRKKIGDSKFYSPRIQQQMIKDRKALGENFFDKQT